MDGSKPSARLKALGEEGNEEIRVPRPPAPPYTLRVLEEG